MQACTTEDGVTGSGADMGYTRVSSPRHAQVKNVVEKRDETWQAPPRVGAMPTLQGVPNPGRYSLNTRLSRAGSQNVETSRSREGHYNVETCLSRGGC